MRRSLTGFGLNVVSKGRLLGWEYVGNYRFSGDKDIQSVWESADSFSAVSKCLQATKLYKSSRSPDGYGHYELLMWRDKLEKALENDASEPGPKWLVEGRSPTYEERKEKMASLAARGRALGFHENISNEGLAKLIVELDEWHELFPIKFVRYDEKIYDYVKDGHTDKDANGKKCADGANPATAQAWYDFLDQLISS